MPREILIIAAIELGHMPKHPGRHLRPGTIDVETELTHSRNQIPDIPGRKKMIANPTADLEGNQDIRRIRLTFTLHHKSRSRRARPDRPSGYSPDEPADARPFQAKHEIKPNHQHSQHEFGPP
jgi:hypothetical protein